MKKKFIKTFIFTKTPLKGKFKFKDIFQIYPLNVEKAPNYKGTNHFPIMIEYWYDEDEVESMGQGKAIDEMFVGGSENHNVLIELVNLLSSLTNHRFFFYNNPETYWGIPLEEECIEQFKEQRNSRSVWSASVYWYDNRDLKIEEFSNSDFTYIELVDDNEYYTNDPVESVSKYIKFPKSINSSLDVYFELGKNARKIAKSTIFQICNGLDLHSKMKSLSFFSYVSAIETLVNFEKSEVKRIAKEEAIAKGEPKPKTKVCSECGREIHSIAKGFVEFLIKNVAGGQESIKLYKNIYSIRSKITHTEYVLNNEHIMDFDFTDKTEQINLNHIEAKQLSRLSFRSWLIRGNK